MTREEIIHVFEHSQLVSDNFTYDAVKAAYIEALAALRAQREAEENKPLTLDELREMDGEPVWCVCGDMAEWMLVGKEDCEGRRYIFDFSNYGEMWLAYRRKLEEVQE